MLFKRNIFASQFKSVIFTVCGPWKTCKKCKCTGSPLQTYWNKLWRQNPAIYISVNPVYNTKNHWIKEQFYSSWKEIRTHPKSSLRISSKDLIRLQGNCQKGPQSEGKCYWTLGKETLKSYWQVWPTATQEIHRATQHRHWSSVLSRGLYNWDKLFLFYEIVGKCRGLKTVFLASQEVLR